MNNTTFKITLRLEDYETRKLITKIVQADGYSLSYSGESYIFENQLAEKKTKFVAEIMKHQVVSIDAVNEKIKSTVPKKIAVKAKSKSKARVR